MTPMKMSLWATACMVLAGCASEAPPAKDDERDAPTDGKLDSFRSPTDAGELDFSDPQVLTLGPGSRYLALTFRLERTADIRVETGGIESEEEIDTVLYLYKAQVGGGFGGYIARNDDVDGGYFSRIEAHLGRGTYRVLVKAYGEEDGQVTLSAGCSGNGCDTAVSSECIFGGSYQELNEGIQGFQPLDYRSSTSAEGLDEDLEAQILAAFALKGVVGESVAEGITSVDDHTVNVYDFNDNNTDEEYRGIEFGRGDTSVGAIFVGRTTEVVAEIDDDAIDSCTVTE